MGSNLNDNPGSDFVEIQHILSRLQEPAKQVQELPMVIDLVEPSQADVHRYDALRLNKGGDHVE